MLQFLVLQSIIKVMEIEAQSIVKSFKDKDIKQLKLPLFKKIPLFD
jgi:hypothetical protein